ncbi:hypothetical protein X805_24100 [Sphaerotilus natans subsp. natans DSM 6575]|uniref:Uncharacterized protein n=1 Tax=Sphaerotilus natans subsp. natans DSM 6575 TaxID=1286631 RepID=A0A059KL30_9BURK|nr:hypothetical protein [Sphaerotilus natans]KDB52040.1 hypothetical protein X805_24100 [Sphaerotilus natans subsp. natans DSM 6575]SIQ09614.1 hypothetical protein SAMN05421778_101342 [Sphaerotilus natans]
MVEAGKLLPKAYNLLALVKRLREALSASPPNRVRAAGLARAVPAARADIRGEDAASMTDADATAIRSDCIAGAALTDSDISTPDGLAIAQRAVTACATAQLAVKVQSIRGDVESLASVPNPGPRLLASHAFKEACRDQLIAAGSEAVQSLATLSVKTKGRRDELTKLIGEANSKIRREAYLIAGERARLIDDYIRAEVDRIKRDGVDIGEDFPYDYVRKSREYNEFSESSHKMARDKIQPMIDEAKKNASGLESELQSINAPAVAEAQALISRLMDAPSVSREEATAWAESQEITKTAINRLKSEKYPVDKLRADMADFYRITNGRIGRVVISSTGKSRASADQIHGAAVATIDIGSGFDKRVLWHELAHHLESDHVLLAAGKGFIEGRSKGVARLSSLAPRASYGPKEKAHADGFFDPYVGKIYDDATEVFSMGVESLSSPDLLVKRIAADPEHFALVAGMVTTPTSDGLARYRRIREELAGLTSDVASQQKSAIDAAKEFLAGRAVMTRDDDAAAKLFKSADYFSLLAIGRPKNEQEMIDAYVGSISGMLLFKAAALISRNAAGRMNRKTKGFVIFAGPDRVESVFIYGTDIDLPKAIMQALAVRENVDGLTPGGWMFSTRKYIDNGQLEKLLTTYSSGEKNVE